MRKLNLKKKLKKTKENGTDANVSEEKSEDVSENESINKTEEDGKVDTSNNKSKGAKQEKSSPDDVEPEKTLEKSKTKSKNKSEESESANELDESDDDSKDKEEEYEVQAIVDHKLEDGLNYYLVRWKGYDENGDTWEPENTLNCAELLEKFKQKQNNKGKKRTSKANQKSTPNKKNKKSEEEDTSGDPEKEWEVEKVIDVAFENESRIFRIRWKGYKPSSDTWEPEENLNCADLIEKFMKKYNSGTNGKDKKDLREDPKKTQRFATSTFGRRASKRNSGRNRAVYYDAE